MLSLIAMNTRKMATVGLGALLMALVAVGGTGCPKPKPPVGPGKPGKLETDAGRFMAQVKARAAGLTRMDARLEIDLQGVEGPFKGKYVGSFQFQRLENQVSLSVQAYTLIGLPALEMVSIGDRLEVYSPLQNILYYNFTDLMKGDSVEELPLDDLVTTTAPVDLIRDQVKLVCGMGFSDRYRYTLQSESDHYVLIEFEGDEIRRQMTYSVTGPDLLEVRVYNAEGLYGSLSCADRFTTPKEAMFLPSRMMIEREPMKVTLTLSHLRVNGDAASDKIAFRRPKDEQLYLLTPAVP
jgi:hypothetical protein